MKAKARKIIRITLLVLALIIVSLLVKFVLHLLLPRNFAGNGVPIPLHLSTGEFQTLYYCGSDDPKGIVIIGTGDGGWSNQFEEPLAKHLAAAGYAVGGWDCRKFADTRTFNQTQLTEAFNSAVDAVREHADLEDDTPVWYTGWSTGAEWALAAAADPEREEHLVAVLPAAPGTRSRYGITRSDLLGLDPQGPGSFALSDLAPGLAGVKVVQFAAGLDPMDDVDWIKKLGPQSPHKVVEIPGVLHDMGRSGDKFLTEFDKALQWSLDSPLPEEAKK
jgi:pimeloyl-ACP methyl ester carboxylesterase